MQDNDQCSQKAIVQAQSSQSTRLTSIILAEDISKYNNLYFNFLDNYIMPVINSILEIVYSGTFVNELLA